MRKTITATLAALILSPSLAFAMGGLLDETEDTSKRQPTMAAVTVTEGTACTVNGASAATTAGTGVVCQNGVWRRSVVFHHAAVSSGSSCSGLPKGALAFDTANKLYVCK